MTNYDACNAEHLPGGAEPTNSEAFWIGTAIYFVFAIFFVLVAVLFSKTGRLSKSNAQLAYVLLPIAVFCMWIMWAMVWLSQWHPLICPEMNHEDD